MDKQDTAIICNFLLAHLSAAQEAVTTDITTLAKSINASTKVVRKCIKHMLTTKPEWFAHAYYSFFGIKSVSLNYRNINEIKYFLSQKGFCESPLFLAKI